MPKNTKEKIKEIVDDFKECYEDSLMDNKEKTKKQKKCAKNLSNKVRSVIHESD